MKKTFLTAAIALCATLWPQISLAQFVFRITGNGLKEPSYIIGTVHTLDGALLDSIPEYQEAVANCRQLYIEIDIYGKTIENYLNDKRKLYTLPDSTNIFNVIDNWIPKVNRKGFLNDTTKETKKLSVLLKERMLQELNVNLDDSIRKPMWNKSPLFFHDTLSVSIKNRVTHQIYGIRDRSNIIDFAITRQARERGWHIGELDELDYLPLDYPKLEKIDIDLQVNYLRSILIHFEEYEQRLRNGHTSEKTKKLVEIVRNGDFEIFEKNRNVSYSIFENLFSNMKSRNEKWLPKMKQAMQEAPTLFDFGANHLVGDEGVLKLLRDAGYEVTLLTKKRE